jgi:hypothetical protein
MLTFEPSFVDSEDMFYAMFENECCIASTRANEEKDDSRKRVREEEPAAAEPVHAIAANKKAKPTAAGIIAGAAKAKPATKA